MARTAKPTIVPFWYNMNGTKEEVEEAEKVLNLEPGSVPMPEEDATPFEVQIKPLTGAEQMALSDHLFVNQATGDVDYTAEGRLMAVRMGLIGWRNINDANESPLPFSIANAMEHLSKDDLRLVSYQVMIHSVVSEEDRKK